MSIIHKFQPLYRYFNSTRMSITWFDREKNSLLDISISGPYMKVNYIHQTRSEIYNVHKGFKVQK